MTAGSCVSPGAAGCGAGDGTLPGCSIRDWPCVTPCSSVKESSRACRRGWHRRSITASVPRFCTRTVTVRGSPGTTGKRMFPLPWSCSETMSTPCFARMNSALWEGRVQAFPAGVGVPEAMPGRCGQGAAGHTTSWHGSGALVEQSWAAGLSQAQTPPPLHSSWVSGTGLPPPHASSPARSSQYQHGPRVLPGVPTGPVLVVQEPLPQPRASLTFLKCTDAPYTCAR